MIKSWGSQWARGSKFTGRLSPDVRLWRGIQGLDSSPLLAPINKELVVSGSSAVAEQSLVSYQNGGAPASQILFSQQLETK